MKTSKILLAVTIVAATASLSRSAFATAGMPGTPRKCDGYTCRSINWPNPQPGVTAVETAVSDGSTLIKDCVSDPKPATSNWHCCTWQIQCGTTTEYSNASTCAAGRGIITTYPYNVQSATGQAPPGHQLACPAGSS